MTTKPKATDAVVREIAGSATQTWQAIAADVFSDEFPTMTAAGVIELVVDADRMHTYGGQGEWSEDTKTFWASLDYPEMVRFLKKHAFTYATYGY